MRFITVLPAIIRRFPHFLKESSKFVARLFPVRRLSLMPPHYGKTLKITYNITDITHIIETFPHARVKR
jgi:hypothetical protein